MMKNVVFVNSPFFRKSHLIREEKEFFNAYFERTKRMFSEQELKEYVEYLTKSVEISGGKTIPVYDLPDPPLWISSLTPIARAAGYVPKVLDLLHLSFRDYGVSDIQNEVKKVDGDIFLYSSFTNNYHLVKKVALAIKETNPNSLNIIGGHHATFTTRETLNDGFDITVRGEGEHTLREILSVIDKEKYSLENIKGISYKNGSAIKDNPNRGLISNLDSLPLPDFDILPDSYKNIFFGREFASRGCPKKCSFCAEALWSKNMPRYKSIDRVMEEINLMKVKLKTRFLFLNDETFTTKASFLKDFCARIPESGLSWSCQTRVDFVNDEKMSIMAKSGCKNVFFGAESADQKVLDMNKKQIKVPAIAKACLAAKSAGMSVCANWLVGLAGESRESALRTIDYGEALLSKGLSDRVDYYICVPYPGTDLYQNSQEYRIKIKTTDFSKFREDEESVTDTEFLSSSEIFDIWKYGLGRFTNAMR